MTWSANLPAPAASPPEVDRLDTRLLDGNRVVRTFVRHATVSEVGAAHVVLRTSAQASRRLTRGLDVAGPGDALPAEGADLAGTVRVDLVRDGIFRIRYAEAPHVPANDNPMVIGPAVGPAVDASIEVSDLAVLVTTPEATMRIDLRPFAISLTDPSGREVAMVGGREKNLWGNWDSFNTGICRTVPEGRPLAVETFALRPHEAVYGFGEKFLRLNKVGQTIDLNMVEALGVTTPRSYKNVPFFVSTAGYGVFLAHSSRITAWVGSRCAPDIQVALEDDFLDYYLILGDIPTVLARYTDLTGKPGLPPRWTFGFWQSRISYSSADEALDVATKMREHHLPFDVLHLDTFWFRRNWFCDLEFDPERFPDPRAFLAAMAALGVKVSLWQLPYIPEGSALFDDLLAVDGFVTTAAGELYDVGICYTPGWEGGRVGCIDFTNPAAVEVHQRYLHRLFDLGARAIKVDFGEEAPLDGVYHDGTPGHRAHNLYPLLYNKAVFEVTERATGEGVIWARSTWAGSQRYPLHWGGDSSANWDNLAPQIAGGLSLGLSGFCFWAEDIGGFVGQPDGAFLIRSMQLGLFLSHARIHGFGDRELYKFDDDVVAVCRQYLELRYRLLPYLWASARACVERSVPMARALVVDFQHDPTVWDIGDQWMLGDALLVAPVLDATGRRRAYLPEGEWTDWWTGARVAGARWIEVDPPLDVLPLWIREGAVVALAPAMQHVDERPIDELTLRVAPFRAERDGENTAVFPIDDDPAHDVTVTYRARGGLHEVVVPVAGPRVVLEPVSGIEVAVIRGSGAGAG